MNIPPVQGDAAAERTRKQRRREGAALRRAVPRGAHGAWSPASDRPDPVATLIEQGRSRIAELLPIRYARMRADPFAFLRGSASVMAADLSATPACGLRLQSCGDAHLGNFGSYATPEGSPVFDINDFDETLPAPFEWDLKRLATSLAVAGRVASYAENSARDLARVAARSYRTQMAALAALPPVVAWSLRIDLAAAIAEIEPHKLRHRMERRLARLLESGAAHFGLLEEDGTHLRDKPPTVFHMHGNALPANQAFASYADTLQEDRRVLLRRYAVRDTAFKAVGVGSVGTLCAIFLLTTADGAPLLLQIKEAQESVLARHAGASHYANHGERVVVGQRMMQAATDAFLGWTREPIEGRHFYVRRLKDSRLADIGARLEAALPFYAQLCGRTLARAHARAGDAAMLAGYMGGGEAFDEAIRDFATLYADQTVTDWHAFRDAIDAGRIVAES